MAMDQLRLRQAIDHNRGLAGPMRWAHALVAAFGSPRFGKLLWVLVILLLIPLDGVIAGPMRKFGASLGGDVRREIAVIMQFGGVSSLVLVSLLVLRLDPAKARRIWDLVVAALVTGGAALVLKMTFGRARPRFDEPDLFLWFWRAMPTSRGPEPRHAWEFWAKGASEFWSMPSSHTSAAFVLGTFLAVVYPRIRWVALGLAAIVAVARLMEGAHWASDVVAGGCVGCWVAGAAVRAGLGQRLAERLGLVRPGPGLQG